MTITFEVEINPRVGVRGYFFRTFVRAFVAGEQIRCVAFEIDRTSKSGNQEIEWSMKRASGLIEELGLETYRRLDQQEIDQVLNTP